MATITELWDTEAPDSIVKKLTKHIHSGDVLDLGAGNGRDSFYLADQGFKVIAVENDPVKLEQLNTKNTESKSKISIIDANIKNYESRKLFDVIICDMVLHFLQLEEIKELISKMQSWTKTGGYNIVTAYTDKNLPGKRPYLFKHNELADYYNHWQVINYEERPTPWFLKLGESEPRRNHAAYLMVRKK